MGFWSQSLLVWNVSPYNLCLISREKQPASSLISSSLTTKPFNCPFVFQITNNKDLARQELRLFGFLYIMSPFVSNATCNNKKGYWKLAARTFFWFTTTMLWPYSKVKGCFKHQASTLLLLVWGNVQYTLTRNSNLPEVLLMPSTNQKNRTRHKVLTHWFSQDFNSKLIHVLRFSRKRKNPF